MVSVDREVDLAFRLVNTYCNEVEPNYGRLYTKTNENLDLVLSISDFEDKDVLTVLSSGDQLLHIQKLNPKSITTFDVNKLTKYLFYLKKWYLLKYKEIFVWFLDKQKIVESFNMVDKSNPDEVIALEFWTKLFYRCTIDQLNSIFYTQYMGAKTDYDMDNLYNFYKEYQLEFELLNIFNRYEGYKKYDRIVMSNIMEFIDENSQVHENLYRMLNPGGEVICSNVATSTVNEHEIVEFAKMNKYFDYEDGATSFDPITETIYQVGYKYIRR